MWVLEFIDDGYILQLDVQKLIYAFQGAFYGHIILELDGNFVIDKGFEEAGCFKKWLAFMVRIKSETENGR